MEVPGGLDRFPCEDYFLRYATAGRWSPREQLQLILPVQEIEELADYDGEDLGFLAVGNAGVDGIRLGYRAHRSGFWAYYPMTGEFARVATDIEQFLTGWSAGTISV